ncbi:MBL fold metallo-hydrolase [Candidatus Woesearchaeota archaeon]|nr:MBL fold metallo-hydrolase [Candidatus Woesearchaeota archaeon]
MNKALCLMILFSAILVAACSQQTPETGTAIPPQPTVTTAAAIVIPVSALSQNVTIHAIAVSSDSFFIDTADSDVLNDAGDKGDADDVLSSLAGINATKVDVLIPSHHHADHIGGTIKVMQTLPVLQVWDSGSEYTTDVYKSFIELAQQRNFIVVRRGDQFTLAPNVTVLILSPADELFPANKENDNSVVYLLTIGKVRVLMEGDCEKECEEDILASGLNISADILKVSHHGSKSASTDAFIDAVSPKVAIIGSSQSSRNKWGIPDEEVLEKLQSRGVEVYDTYEQGTFSITTDGFNYAIIK